eukprot:scaffold117891_cov72-Phaeocystis_antarctica.AAC.1
MSRRCGVAGVRARRRVARVPRSRACKIGGRCAQASVARASSGALGAPRTSRAAAAMPERAS